MVVILGLDRVGQVSKESTLVTKVTPIRPSAHFNAIQYKLSHYYLLHSQH